VGTRLQPPLCEIKLSAKKDRSLLPSELLALNFFSLPLCKQVVCKGRWSSLLVDVLTLRRGQPSKHHTPRQLCNRSCSDNSVAHTSKADILYVDEAPTPPLAQHEVGERDLAHASSQTTYFCNSSTGKKKAPAGEEKSAPGLKGCVGTSRFRSLLGAKPMLWDASAVFLCFAHLADANNISRPR
jgi:hypothetical protein